ncbi:hypothetical protein ACFQZI_07790 [Mucilaginibacter lutimaris]|uniref:Uncharacterized protein n=1 Tax=Mucilaginibacter lutimaris TaxID=931629 RepID=A0ABW2ZEW7_9SPHI
MDGLRCEVYVLGVEEDLGTYTISNDTIKLNYLSSCGAADKFKYAVLDSTETYLKFYNTKSVTDPYLLRITLNKTKLH